MWMKHIVVITIGRSRTRAACTTASSRDCLQLAIAGEFDDQDGVLARQADEHHEPDLGEHVIV